ncbi:MFS transporter [Vibrio aerogenes]|uniref:MFS transporter n=1 Tax=Vibrio aerogenes TaxID=92172 RepID=UPI0021C32B07|nr:MFS transporter [Vibrio aerogenes]
MSKIIVNETSCDKGPLPYRTVLVLLLLASMLTVMAGAIITPVVEVMRGDLKIDGTAAGLILTMHGLVIAVSSPLAGWLIDRWGRCVPLAAGLVMYGLAGGAGVFAESYQALIASRIIFGLGAALVFTGTTVAMLALYRGTLRDRVMGWRTTATSIGGVIFPLIGGGLATLMSWHAAFGVYLIGLPIGIAVLAMMPASQEKAQKSTRQQGDAMLTLLRQPALTGIFFLVIVQAVMLYALAVFLPQRLAELGYQMPVVASLYMALMSGTSSVIGAYFGRLRQRWSYLALLRWTAVAWVGAFLLLGLSGDLWLLAVGSAITGISNALAFSTTSVMVADFVPEKVLGRAMAVFSTCMFLGQFLSPVLLGALIEQTSLTTGYLMLSGGATLILTVLLLMRQERKLTEKAL